MPLYICNARSGTISEAVKPKIAKELTDIHCEVTDAPPTFVHVFFMEPEGIEPNAVELFGTIRGGRTDEQKQSIYDQMCAAVVKHGGLEAGNVSMSSVDIPASWVMEGGDILPEPGDEAAWLAKHAG